MATFFERTTRHILPRWRPFRAAAKSGELRDRALPSSARNLSAEFRQKIAAWRSGRTIDEAAELVLASIVENQKAAADVRGAAELVYRTDRGPLRDLAAELLDKASESMFSTESAATVALLRRRLRNDPRNAIVAVDLALAYTTIAQLEKAEKALDYARMVAPENRFVMRATARFWAHRRDPERAHAVFTSSSRTITDPWLLAGEIGTADLAMVTPKYIKAARRLVAGGLAPSEITELAAALASVELRGGDIRSARKLFRIALEAPTENSVAQAIWAAYSAKAAEPTTQHLALGRAFEAQAREAAHNGEWLDSVVASEGWLMDQRFSVSAAAFGSYIASVGLGNYERGLEFAQRGLDANPRDTLMLNNYAFCAASLGDVAKAEQALAKVPLAAFDSDGVLLATMGLVEFRRGSLEKGRLLYNRSIDVFRKAGLPKSVALASIFFAREELRAGTQAADVTVERAGVAAKGRFEPEIVRLLALLQSSAVSGDHGASL